MGPEVLKTRFPNHQTQRRSNRVNKRHLTPEWKRLPESVNTQTQTFIVFRRRVGVWCLFLFLDKIYFMIILFNDVMASIESSRMGDGTAPLPA